MITRNRILFALGIWTALVPLLGFPSSFETLFTIASGLFVVLIAFLFSRDKRMPTIRQQGSQQQNAQHAQNTEQRSQQQSVYSSHQNLQQNDDELNPKRYADLRSILNRTRTPSDSTV